MKDFILDDTNAPSDNSMAFDSTAECNESRNKLNENSFKSKSNKFNFKIDKELLKFKAFFLLFFAGFGSTFPYLGVYFKQIGLNATYVGILAGVRPLIQFISGPFWALLADKYKARKSILLFSILAWLVMTLLLAFPRPHREVCRKVNETRHLSIASGTASARSQISVAGIFQGHFGEVIYTNHCPNCKGEKLVGKRDTYYSTNTKNLPGNVIRNKRNKDEGITETSSNKGSGSWIKTKSPVVILNVNLEYQNKTKNNKDNKKEREHKSERIYSIRYVIERDQNEIRYIFYILLVLIVVGEFLEAPSFIMIDTALLDHLGSDKKHYGKTRLFGSIGYGVASFSVGALLDHFQYEFCGKVYTNYMVIFYLFTGFMIIGFLFGLFFVKFKYNETKEGSKPLECIKVFLSVKFGSFLTICWFCGFCHGSIMNFLNWFLEDLGASKLMMGVATACRCMAIITGFFTSSYFIEKIGHIQLICWSLFSYVASYFAYAALHNPWWAIPVEVIQGLIYAISWSSCITYLGEAAPPNTAATMQGTYDLYTCVIHFRTCLSKHKQVAFLSFWVSQIFYLVFKILNRYTWK